MIDISTNNVLLAPPESPLIFWDAHLSMSEDMDHIHRITTKKSFDVISDTLPWKKNNEKPLSQMSIQKSLPLASPQEILLSEAEHTLSMNYDTLLSDPILRKEFLEKIHIETYIKPYRWTVRLYQELGMRHHGGSIEDIREKLCDPEKIYDEGSFLMSKDEYITTIIPRINEWIKKILLQRKSDADAYDDLFQTFNLSEEDREMVKRDVLINFLATQKWKNYLRNFSLNLNEIKWFLSGATPSFYEGMFGSDTSEFIQSIIQYTLDAHSKNALHALQQKYDGNKSVHTLLGNTLDRSPEWYVHVYHYTHGNSLEKISQWWLALAMLYSKLLDTKDGFEERIKTDEIFDQYAPQWLGFKRQTSMYALPDYHGSTEVVGHGNVLLEIAINPQDAIVVDATYYDQSPSYDLTDEAISPFAKKYWASAIPLQDFLRLSPLEQIKRFINPEILIKKDTPPERIKVINVEQHKIKGDSITLF